MCSSDLFFAYCRRFDYIKIDPACDLKTVASTDRDQHSLDLVYDGGYNSAGLKWQLRYFDMNEDYEYKDPPSFVHSRAQTDNQGAQAQLSWNWNILTLTGGVDWLDNDYSPQQDQSRSELENEAAFLMAKVALLEEKKIGRAHV